MALAKKCDFCNKFYEDEESLINQNLQFRNKSLEIEIKVKEAQENTEFDVCAICLGEIMVKVMENKTV